MNGVTDFGEIPANESVKIRPIVTAGLANEVDDVKKYALAIQAGIKNSGLPFFMATIKTRPKLATTSPK